MLVASDHITDKDYPAADMVKGDLFVCSIAQCRPVCRLTVSLQMIFGASLYGFSQSLSNISNSQPTHLNPIHSQRL